MRNGGNRQDGWSENRPDDWDGTRQEGGFRHTVLCSFHAQNFVLFHTLKRSKLRKIEKKGRKQNQSHKQKTQQTQET